MATGTITKFFARGFGFIRPDDGGDDLFFHVSGFSGPSGAEPEQKVKVQYEVGRDPVSGRVRAENVRPV